MAIATVIPVCLGLLLLYVLRALFLFLRNNKRSLPLPPGPKGLPLLGNVNDLPLPGQPEFQHWVKHRELYGDLSSITVLGQTIIIIHNKDVAVELMEKRAAIHSGRPRSFFASQMCGWGETLVAQPYGHTLRLYRKYAHQQLGSKVAIARFFALQEAAVGRFLWRLAKDEGKNLESHLNTEAVEIMLKMLYGYTIEHLKPDAFVKDAGEALEQFSEATVPGRWLVDLIPALEHIPTWMPGAGFKRTSKLWKQTLTRFANLPYSFVKQQMASGRASASYVSQSIEQAKAEGKPLDAEREHAIKWSAASMYSGGADTSVSTIAAFFLAMSMFPDVQRKAQEEIDRVVGNQRLPTFSDREKLPYINAIVEEAQRWHPIAAMNGPHATDEDDEIHGYRIPKGAILLAGIWWWTRDPSVYHSPEDFKPERFSAPYNEPYATNFTFGLGRRVCPGRLLADSSVFLTVVQSLAVFQIGKATDAKTGKIIEPEHAYMPGIITHTAPFGIKVEPRSEEHAALIRRVIEQYPMDQSDAEALRSLTM